MSKFSPLGGNEGEGELLRRSKRSRPGAYGVCADEMHENGFPALRVGSRFVVPKEKVRQWVERQIGGAE